MAHCRRELMQAVWKYMLDDDFIRAIIYKVVVTCYDGIRRRFYPRIFTYSADYPERWAKCYLKRRNSDISQGPFGNNSR